MEQYYRLFSCYRMPDEHQDRLIQLHNSKLIDHQAEHVIVAYRNQFFVLNVVINFTRLDEDDIYTQLRRIVAMADDDPWVTDEVGIYTSLPRRTWSTARTELMNGKARDGCLSSLLLLLPTRERKRKRLERRKLSREAIDSKWSRRLDEMR